MTNADRILKHLESGSTYTNGELSRDLNIPEASVRRTTLKLEYAQKIYNVSEGTPLVWQLRSQVSAAPTA